MDSKDGKNPEKYVPNVLTGIPPSYTLSATQTGETSEVDELMVKHFFNTLAEIALAVASRKEAEK